MTLRISREFLMICAVKLISSCTLSGPVIQFCPKLKSLEVTFNNILRKIWRLPRRCHTGILHCTAKVYSIINRIIDLFTSAYKRAVASKCDLVRTTFMLSSSLIYCPIGYNYRTSHSIKLYSDDDRLCSDTVRDIQLGHLHFGSKEETKNILCTICCD